METVSESVSSNVKIHSILPLNFGVTISLLLSRGMKRFGWLESGQGFHVPRSTLGLRICYQIYQCFSSFQIRPLTPPPLQTIIIS